MRRDDARHGGRGERKDWWGGGEAGDSRCKISVARMALEARARPAKQTHDRAIGFVDDHNP